MPNITQYTNPDTTIDTTGFSQAARRIGAAATQTAGSVEQAGRQLGQGIEQGANELGKTVEQHIDYWDQTRVLSQKTAVLADSEQKWQTLLKGTPDPNNPGKFIIPPADPTDKDLAARFMRDQVEPALQDLQKTPLGIHGADFAANQAGEIRQHLQTALTADMSSLAGKAVQISDERVKNNSAALIAADPSFHNVDMGLRTMDQLNTAHSSVGTLTADMAMSLKMHNEAGKEELVHTAVAAAIERSGNPEQVVKDFTAKYPDYIKPAQEIALAKQARAQIKYNAYLDKQNAAAEDKIAGRQAVQATNDIYTRVMERGYPVGQDTKDLINAAKSNPQGFAVDKDLLKSTHDWIQTQSNKSAYPVESDKDVTKDFLARASLPPDDPNSLKISEVFRAGADHSLTKNDFSLYKQLADHKDPQLEFSLKQHFYPAMKSVDELLIDRTAGPDPLGEATSANIRSSALKLYMDAFKDPSITPEKLQSMLDMKDPNSALRKLVDPQLPNLKDRTQVKAFLAATGTQAKELQEGPGLLERAKAWFSSDPTTNAVPVKDPSDVTRMKLAPGTAIKLPDGSIRYVPQPKDGT